jgi:WD40 repeat protein
MTRALRGVWCGGLFAAVVCCAVPGVANATKYDMSPRRAILFADGTRFIAQDRSFGYTLYRTSDGAVLHRFPESASIDLSPDEKRVLVSLSDGSLYLWNVETGEQVCRKGADATGLKSATRTIFAANGGRFACQTETGAIVFDAKTGDRIDGASLPREGTVASVALEPDGKNGFFIDYSERLYRFDVATGRVRDTGFTGAWPVRCSADGKFVAFRSSNSGTGERLSVVRIGEKLTKRDLGEFSHIAHIRPARDGSFLVTAEPPRRFDGLIVGSHIRPEEERVQELWRLPWEQGVNERTDFQPESMIGVSTDYRLITTVTDLRTGKVMLTIDNSANYVPYMISTSHPGRIPPDWPAPWVIFVSIVSLTPLVCLLIWRVRRSGRRSA